MVPRTRLSVTLYTYIACLLGHMIRILTHPILYLLSFSIQIPGQYLQLVFDHFLPHPFQYIVHLLSNHRTNMV